LKFGKVYIVGAGPGDPELITVKALRKLEHADVVVYDRLISNDLLFCCKKECEKIFAGKESGYHPIEQELIIEILINKSKLGLNVVRLKGGNPFVFGRGSEEAAALKKAGIEFEIIPGVTSGLSAPIYSGIPITHRGLITQCVLITAHECPGKPETQVEWQKLALLKNTNLIIYMGASRLERICKELIKNGMSPKMPVAVIENGTMPEQRTITANLDNIAEEFKKQNFHPPVIIMISPTVLLRDEITWFDKLQVSNNRITGFADMGKVEKLYETNLHFLKLKTRNKYKTV
jgi:uroporphyrin-III C-methyltransferase